ncbi:MAG: hypothetical protein FWG40_01825 [Peptococcaceae bacterium]|nr:hypothetical protein [Peptococcaceae bacterium]
MMLRIGMRKLVLVLLFCMEAFLVFQILYRAEDTYRFYEFVNAEITTNSHRVVFEVDQDNSKKIYDALISLADQLNANVIVNRLTVENGISKCTKYVYITRQEYYNGFVFYENDPGYPAGDSGQFLSTEKTGSPSQTGRLISFDRNKIGEIRTLYDCLYGDGPYEGLYIIQIEGKSFAMFSEAFYDRMGITMVEGENLATEPPVSGFMLIAALAFALICFLPLIVLVFFYDIVGEAKNIALEIMLGHWERTIWFKRVLILLRNQSLAFIGVLLLMFVIRLRLLNTFALIFLAKLFFVSLMVLVMTMGFAVITFYSIGKIKINTALKQKQPLRFIPFLNSAAKTGVLILIILLCQYAVHVVSGKPYQARSYWTDHSVSDRTLYEDWEQTHDLFILPDIDPSYLGKSYASARQSSYHPLNKNGSILADFIQFTPESGSPGRTYPVATVNPNYLKAFPLRDTNGNIVWVEEDSDDKILLVPEKYRGEESQIRSYFAVGTQNVNLIWLQNDQPSFTFSLLIYPDTGNTVSNIILNVLTEENGQEDDYDVIFGNGNPLKIKSVCVDPEGELRKMLADNKIDDNVGRIISVYNYTADEVRRSTEMAALTLFVLAVLIPVLIMIVVQSVDNAMTLYKRLIGIQTFLGRSFWPKYKLYFFHYVAPTWAVVVVASLVLTRLFDYADWRVVLLFFLILWCIELLTTFLTILVLQKRRVLETLKGGG